MPGNPYDIPWKNSACSSGPESSGIAALVGFSADGLRDAGYHRWVAAAPQRRNDLRDLRYCEIFLIGGNPISRNPNGS
jgi:hypothetical protein